MDDTIGESGRTLEELSDYFDAGRSPAIDAIEQDPECRAMLASMERMSRLTRALAAEESRVVESSWVDRVLAVVRDEVRAGRDLPLETIDDRTETTVTEGALRELVRRAGDEVDGVLVGSVELRFDEQQEPHVRVTIGVRFGSPMRERADDVRSRIRTALAAHAPTPVQQVDVVIDDVFEAGVPDA
ncbi:hypothetical protein [Agrococcus sp. Marseille-P2731]|uniref:hypothetical protein n=1 Tax=Agrococcus sp. Marseille-P2731 TaxID=1841862 RepID=UPI000931B1A6|nr:hypothetical protein [Agrococcus sp. Marseille-P2731]